MTRVAKFYINEMWTNPTADRGPGWFRGSFGVNKGPLDPTIWYSGVNFGAIRGLGFGHSQA